MDIRMPVLDGLAATRLLLDDRRRGRTGPQVLILTTFDLDDYVYEALRAGASGFLLKDAPAAELVHAVRVVAAGDALLAPSVTRRLIAEFARPRRDAGPARRARRLTQRETEVLRADRPGPVQRGDRADLVVAEQTVKTHVGRILTKLDLRDRAQAVVFAYEIGPGGPRRSLTDEGSLAMSSRAGPVRRTGCRTATRRLDGRDGEYLVLIYGDEQQWDEAREAERQRIDAGHVAFRAAAGPAVLGGHELDSSRRSVSIRGDARGNPTATDGPFLETKEVLGGFYVLEAPDIDQAVALAGRLPEVLASHSGVEVRPLREPH